MHDDTLVLGPESVARREFARLGLSAAGLCYVAAIGYPVYRYLATPAKQAQSLAAVREVSLPRGDLPAPGTAMMFRFGAHPALLIHHPDGTLSCFDAVCTHLGCTVQYQPEAKRIYCACHGGEYDERSGKNVAGPPPRPLTPYTVEMKDEQILITRA